ncbi:MAG TPA: PQQ-binding-like beta-propeller repeat protein [Acidimicrobiales bacterium]|nr:PQQ-binding-like beta-propeller repeat protein [Acidimicrobiales bacterium]
MKLLVRGVVVGVGVVALAGCWPVPGANSDRTNVTHDDVINESFGSLVERWRWTSPHGAISAPVTSAGGVHVVSRCFLDTLDPDDGDLRWEGNIEPGGCSPVSGRDDHVGEPWVVSSPQGDEVTAGYGWIDESTPGIVGADWRGTHFDVTDGDVTGTSGDFTVAVRGETLVSSIVVDAGSGVPANRVRLDGREFLLHLDGAPTRSLTLGADLLYHSGDGVLAIEPGPAAFGPGVRGYSRAEARPDCGPAPAPTGVHLVECPVWATPTDGTPSVPVLSPDGSSVFVRTDAGTLYAIDAATGAVQWTAPGLSPGGRPALADGILWVPSGSLVIAYVAAGCGEPTCSPWLTTFMGVPTDQPVTDVTVVDDIVFATSDGQVFAARNCIGPFCGIGWSAPGHGPIVVSNGRLYVTDGADTLIAYSVPS